jgi:hypothetical protein
MKKIEKQLGLSSFTYNITFFFINFNQADTTTRKKQFINKKYYKYPNRMTESSSVKSKIYLANTLFMWHLDDFAVIGNFCCAGLEKTESILDWSLVQALRMIKNDSIGEKYLPSPFRLLERDGKPAGTLKKDLTRKAMWMFLEYIL